MRLFAQAWIAIALLGGAPAARAQDQTRPPSVDTAAEPNVVRGIFGLRLLAPVYLGDVTMPGGTDYVGGHPHPGVGVRADAALQVYNFTIGLAFGYAYNPMTPQLMGDTRDTLTDWFVALLAGYRTTVEDVLVIGAALGAGLHVLRPSGGGTGLRVELEIGWQLHPHAVLGGALALEIIDGASDSTGQVARATPALVFELLI